MDDAKPPIGIGLAARLILLDRLDSRQHKTHWPVSSVAVR